MKLYEKIEKYFPDCFDEDKIKYLEDEPFMTESCGDCSHLRWGSFSGELLEDLEEDEDGTIPCCSEGDTIWEMDTALDACSLAPEKALEWYFGDRPDGVCKRFDGKIPYTKQEIKNWIEKRDSVIKKVTGFNNLSQLEDYIKKSELY